MNLLIFAAFFLIHNSFAQLPPQVTARIHRHGQIHQENDLSLNSLRNDLNAFKLQLERVEISNNQVFNAVKAHRRDMEDVKNTLNKVQAQCIENQIFTSPTTPQFIDTSNNSLNKLDNLHQLVLTLKSSLHKIEREVIATRKATNSKRSHWSNNQIIHQRNHHNIYDHESACTADDVEVGIKKIRKNFFIYCENIEDDGNWIVIQNRFNGDINFFRSWNEYKDGFGNVGGEFWLGLEKIHELTSDSLHELLIIIEDFNGVKSTAKYNGFAISSEAGGYALSVLGKYSGDAGDALNYHAGMKFSTFDVDNDEWTDGSCAKSHMGGWWFRQCDESNLNGAYLPEDENSIKSNDYKGMHWKHAENVMTALKSVKMMIRPID